MATESNKTQFPGFFTSPKSAEAMRRQNFEAPLEAAGPSALASAVELGNLFSILPAAFVASQERELKRLLSSGAENDPRATALKSSIEQAGVLQTTAERGKIRVERALLAAGRNDHVFQGFVSDSALRPQEGFTVRLTQSKLSKALSTKTDADGYFCIPLASKSSDEQDSKTKASMTSLSQRISDFMTGPGIESGSSSSERTIEDASQVEILQKGNLLHSDPVSVARGEGSVYREYIIDETKPCSSSDLRSFVSGASAKDVEGKTGRAKGAADASQKKSASSDSTVTAATRRSSKKKSPSGAKVKKPKNK